MIPTDSLRVWSKLLLLLALPLAGCNSLKQLQIIPGAGVQVLSKAGQTAQFKAVGTYQMGSASASTQDVTQQVMWASATPSIATISSSGLATAVGPGTTVITAESGGVTASSDVTVTASTPVPAAVPTLTIIPGPASIPSPTSAAAARVGETTQFLAIGNLSGVGATQDLTNMVRWVSSDVEVATINQTGLATGVAVVGSASTTTITAIATTASGSVITATSTLTVTPSTGAVHLPTLAIYKVGSGTGTVISSPTGIDCGPQATCTGDFQLSAPVMLTAKPDSGSSFGGWSANCVPSNSLTCMLTMGDNDTVGVIFNQP